jgi:methyl acetate hydrolase
MNRQTMAALVMMPIAFALSTGPAQAQNSPARPSALIDQKLREAVERKDVPGVVALVTDRKGVIYQGAFGVADVATGRPLTADALFRIASMTKAITSTAAMQLIEQGKFALEDPVEKYLPEMAKLPVFDSFDARTGNYHLHLTSKPITVRHILTHTSGLGYPFTSATLRDFKPRAGESYPDGPAAVRTRREMDLRHVDRYRRAPGRESVGAEAGRLLPPTHLHAAQDDRHVL